MSDEILKTILATMVVLAFCAAAYALFILEVPSGSRDYIAIMLGVLSSSLKEILGYYFGSSSPKNGK